MKPVQRQGRKASREEGEEVEEARGGSDVTVERSALRPQASGLRLSPLATSCNPRAPRLPNPCPLPPSAHIIMLIRERLCCARARFDMSDDSATLTLP